MRPSERFMLVFSALQKPFFVVRSLPAPAVARQTYRWSGDITLTWNPYPSTARIDFIIPPHLLLLINGEYGACLCKYRVDAVIVFLPNTKYRSLQAIYYYSITCAGYDASDGWSKAHSNLIQHWQTESSLKYTHSVWLKMWRRRC